MFKLRSKHTNQFQKQLSLNTIQNSPTHHQRYNTEHIPNQIAHVNSNTIPHITSKRTKVYARNTDTMTIYTCKDKAEEYFSKKIRNVIENDPALKNESATAFYNTRRDQWKPEGYLYYDFLLKHPLMIQEATYMNKFGRKLPKINSHEIKASQAKSKIFSTENDMTSTRQSSLDYYNKLFNKEKEKTISETIDKEENENDDDKHNKEEEFLKTSPISNKTASIRYTDSDVLNVKNDHHLLGRSGETYLFKNQQTDPKIFKTTTESKSDWIPKQLKRLTLMNHTSVQHNVISPSHKAWSYTKDDVTKSNDTFYKINSVSQFVDLTRVSAPNLNKEHTQTLRDNKSPFAKTNNIGATYEDMHHTYRELFKKSFWK